MTDIITSILKIKSDAKVNVNGNTIDGIEWLDGNPTNITNEEILAKQTELVQEKEDDKTTLDTNKASGKAKLKAGEALNDAEHSALFGD